jgi:F-type H+-transporting ATPase subunit epsilon
MLLEIITPEKTVFQGEITSVILPGEAGSFGVLNNHAPIISTLEKGSVKFLSSSKPTEKDITTNTDGSYSFEVSGGVAEVLDNKIIVLAD